MTADKLMLGAPPETAQVGPTGTTPCVPSNDKRMSVLPPLSSFSLAIAAAASAGPTSGCTQSSSSSSSNDTAATNTTNDILKSFIATRASVQEAAQLVQRLQWDLCESQHEFRSCQEMLQRIQNQGEAFRQHQQQPDMTDRGVLQKCQLKFQKLRNHLTILEGQINTQTTYYQQLKDHLKELTLKTAAHLGLDNERNLLALIDMVEAPLRSAMDAQAEVVTCPICVDRRYTHVLCCCGKPVCKPCLGQMRTHVCPFCRHEKPDVREIRL